MDMDTIASQLSIGAQDNKGVGFGEASPEQVAKLLKSLSAGHKLGTDPTGTGANALKVESLERNLKSIIFQETALRLWGLCPKLPASSTVEQFNLQTSIGDEDGGFMEEGGIPEETDSNYERKAEFVKYIGTVRGVTLPAKMTNMSIGALKTAAIQDGIKYILRRANRALFDADESVVPLEWNGILTQHKNYFGGFGSWLDSANIIDMRGQAIGEAELEDASQIIDDNHGYSDTLIGHTSVISNFGKRFHNSKFFRPNSPEVSAAQVGQRVNKVFTSFSDLNIEKDRFMNDQRPRLLTANSTNPKAPAAPTADGTTPVAAVADPLTKFADSAGDYYVAVAAQNQYGISPLTQLGAGAISVAAGESLDLKFTATAGAYATNGFVIYISKKDEAKPAGEAEFFPVFRVSAAQLAAGYDGGAAGIVRNRNRILPNTRKAMVFQNSASTPP